MRTVHTSRKAHKQTKRRTGVRMPKIRRAEWGSPFAQRTVYSALETTTTQEFFSQRVTFLIAIFTVLAFVMGNMVGTHGWHVFWSSVMGEQVPDSAITFEGTVAPIAQVPDLQRWAKLGGNTRDHTFREVPSDLLIPLPAYSPGAVDQKSGSYYFVDHMGTYATGHGDGSHPGIDIAVPVGTPVQSIAAGVVLKSEQDSGGYGKFVTIKHPNVPDPTAPGARLTVYSTYAHLSAQMVQPGMIVRKGEQIGLSGMTGFASGPHLHFQLDRDTAPFHPYWPFSGKEARDAGMDFTQAVNAGLHRERGMQYMLNPMTFVQANLNGYTVVNNTPARTVTSSSRSASSVLTVANRRNARLSRQSSSATVVALARSSTSSSVSPVVVASTAATVASGIGTITVRHDGEITSVGQRETLRLEVVGSDGETVQKPKFDKPIELRTAFGQAKFTPARVTAADFRNGQAQVTMEALSPQTIVVQLQPSGVMSAPIRFIR